MRLLFVSLVVALAELWCPSANAARPREIVKSIGDDITVRVILTEAVQGRFYTESRVVREHPEMCAICERMALTRDSLIWIPVGVGWERDLGLLVDPVITLRARGHRFTSREAWAGRPTDRGLVSIRAPVWIPTGWECDPEFKDWKGVSIYVAFPRELYSETGGWPIALHLEEVEDAEIDVN
jgi:hypothetical protein